MRILEKESNIQKTTCNCACEIKYDLIWHEQNCINVKNSIFRGFKNMFNCHLFPNAICHFENERIKISNTCYTCVNYTTHNKEKDLHNLYDQYNHAKTSKI